MHHQHKGLLMDEPREVQIRHISRILYVAISPFSQKRVTARKYFSEINKSIVYQQLNYLFNILSVIRLKIVCLAKASATPVVNLPKYLLSSFIIIYLANNWTIHGFPGTVDGTIKCKRSNMFH